MLLLYYLKITLIMDPDISSRISYLIPHDEKNCPLVARVQALCRFKLIQRHNFPTTKQCAWHMRQVSSRPKVTIEGWPYTKTIRKTLRTSTCLFPRRSTFKNSNKSRWSSLSKSIKKSERAWRKIMRSKKGPFRKLRCSRRRQ